jgi:cbb3-type cytochrome oxidase subunit 3
MILQGAEYIAAMLLISIVIWIIIFLVGVVVTKWRARKKGWNAEWKPAILLNLFWLVVGIVCNFIPLVGFILAIIINLFVGAYVAAKLYDKEYGKSLVFVIIVWIFLIIIWIILTIILVVIILAVVLGTGAAGGASSNGGPTGLGG